MLPAVGAIPGVGGAGGLSSLTSATKSVTAGIGATETGQASSALPSEGTNPELKARARPKGPMAPPRWNSCPALNPPAPAKADREPARAKAALAKRSRAQSPHWRPPSRRPPAPRSSLPRAGRATPRARSRPSRKLSLRCSWPHRFARRPPKPFRGSSRPRSKAHTLRQRRDPCQPTPPPQTPCPQPRHFSSSSSRRASAREDG